MRFIVCSQLARTAAFCNALWRAAGVLGILATHGPRAFGKAFAVGLDGVDLLVY